VTPPFDRGLNRANDCGLKAGVFDKLQTSTAEPPGLGRFNLLLLQPVANGPKGTLTGSDCADEA
jgi:hypothetical protein